MKKITLIVLSFMMVFASQSFASTKKEINQILKASLTPVMLNLHEKDGWVNVSFTVNIPKDFVNKNTQFILTPILTDLKDVEKLPSIVVTGHKYQKFLQKRGMSAFEIPYMKDGYMLPVVDEAQVLTYNYNVKFEPWMQNANLIVDQRFITKKSNSVIAEDLYAKGIKYHPVVEEVVVVQPEIVTVVVNSKEGLMDLSFPISSNKIDMTLGNNMREMAMLKSTINSIIEDPYTTIEKVKITASSSPDGVYNKNVTLTKERAESVKAYILKAFGKDFPNTDNIVACNIPENWDLMKILVEMNPQTNVKEVMNLFEIKDLNQRSKAMLKIPQFNYIKKHILPELRFVKYEIFTKSTAVAVAMPE